MMKPDRKSAAALSLAIALTGGAAAADGFAQPLMEPEVIVEETANASAGGIIVPLLLLAVIAAVAAGGGGGAAPPVIGPA